MVGTAGFVLIEATAFALALFAYFYLRSKSPEWPPRVAPPDLLWGTLNTIKIAHYCDANGLTFSPHCALFGPGQIATLHLTAAQRRPPLFERLYLDFETELFGAPPPWSTAI
jgi:L-alanine-DL-glutamate epimerase-like enolase superfamily enzyme